MVDPTMNCWMSTITHQASAAMDREFLKRTKKKLVVVIMGATGTGKSKLSIDLASIIPAEIVNSDKMQVYKGLDIVTNKVTREEQSGIQHHLLGIINPSSDFTAEDFCDKATQAVNSISSRGLLPIIVGGSNSFIEALVGDKNHSFRSKYDCCFLWVDVEMSVLHNVVSERVNQMVQRGLVDEARDMFDPSADYSKGIRRSIGIPELDGYLRSEAFLDEESRRKSLEASICAMKANTCHLAVRQYEKIRCLRDVRRWNIHRIDATKVFLKAGEEANQAWDNKVARRSICIVNKALYGIGDVLKAAAALRTLKKYKATECIV